MKMKQIREETIAHTAQPLSFKDVEDSMHAATGERVSIMA